MQQNARWHRKLVLKRVVLYFGRINWVVVVVPGVVVVVVVVVVAVVVVVVVVVVGPASVSKWQNRHLFGSCWEDILFEADIDADPWRGSGNLPSSWYWYRIFPGKWNDNAIARNWANHINTVPMHLLQNLLVLIGRMILLSDSPILPEPCESVFFLKGLWPSCPSWFQHCGGALLGETLTGKLEGPWCLGCIGDYTTQLYSLDVPLPTYPDGKSLYKHYIVGIYGF